MALSLSMMKTNMDEFYEMTIFARKPCYNELDFQCTRTHFTLTVSCPSQQGCCFIELQLQAQFFPHYAVTPDDTTLHRAISPRQFFITFHQMSRSGFDFVILSLTNHRDSLKLSFCNISDPPDPLDLPYHVDFPFLSTHEHLDPNRARSTTFVAFPPFPLQSMLATTLNSNDSHFTFTVTLTTSQAKFTGKDHMGRDVGFILSVQSGECVIEDVAEGKETEIVMVLNPIESFKNIISQPNPENYWMALGKSNNGNNRGIIIICRGLYAQYFFYSTL